mgnify:CR=1
DKNTTFGIFFYKDDKNECDIEIGRWGKFLNRNCQFVMQSPHQICRFWNFNKIKKIGLYLGNGFCVYKLDNNFSVFWGNTKAR